MKLDTDKLFNTWKAQLLVCINKILTTNTLDFANHEVNFTVSCISITLMVISCDEEYIDMLGYLVRTRDLVCTIYVQELQLVALSKVCW